MSWFFWCIVILGILCLLFFGFFLDQCRFWWWKIFQPEKFPYSAKKHLLHTYELQFFQLLQSHIASEYVIYPQVVLSNILKVNIPYSSKQEGQDFWFFQNKINKKTLDFVIFSAGSLTPLLAIEYDGWHHGKLDRKKRDAFVDQVLQDAHIPIYHVLHRTDRQFENDLTQIKMLLSSKKSS